MNMPLGENQCQKTGKNGSLVAKGHKCQLNDTTIPALSPLSIGVLRDLKNYDSRVEYGLLKHSHT